MEKIKTENIKMLIHAAIEEKQELRQKIKEMNKQIKQRDYIIERGAKEIIKRMKI